GTMKHSAPVENSSDSVPADQLFKSAVVFSMGGAWTLDINFHNHLNNKEGKGVLALNVTNPTTAVMRNFIVAADDSARLFVSLVQPASPKIGLNDFEITIHKKADMMNYPAVENYTVEIEPEMPSMGHGSPNNVNPVHTTNGHYLGKVNFTMSGLWRVHLTIKKNGVLLSNDQYFDITF
ncbi:MAG: FixH family protein, partial [Bacteroidia bacterium]